MEDPGKPHEETETNKGNSIRKTVGKTCRTQETVENDYEECSSFAIFIVTC